jgi:hypothetical protein
MDSIIIPGFQHQAACAAFAELLPLFFFEDAEDFGGEIQTVHILWIKNIGKFVTGETVTFTIVRDKFDTKRIKQPLPAEHEQSHGGQSDELGKEAVK